MDRIRSNTEAIVCVLNVLETAPGIIPAIMRQAAIHRILDILHSLGAVNNLNPLPRASRLLFRFLQRGLRRNPPPLPGCYIIEEKKGFRIYRKRERIDRSTFDYS
jgi:hypothetical protein